MSVLIMSHMYRNSSEYSTSQSSIFRGVSSMKSSSSLASCSNPVDASYTYWLQTIVNYLSSFSGFSFIPVNERDVDSFVLSPSLMAFRAPSTFASSPLKKVMRPSLMASLLIPDLRTDLRILILPFLRLMVSIPWETICFLTVSLRRFSSWFKTLISAFASESCFVRSTSLETFVESSLGTEVIIKCFYALIFKRTNHAAWCRAQWWSCSTRRGPWGWGDPCESAGWRYGGRHQQSRGNQSACEARGSSDPRGCPLGQTDQSPRRTQPHGEGATKRGQYPCSYRHTQHLRGPRRDLGQGRRRDHYRRVRTGAQ